MKKMFTMAIVLAGTVVAAGAASAQSAAYCDSYARGEMERLYPTGGGAVSGAVAGGILGGLVAGATKGNVGTGVGVGAGAGLVVGSASWQAKRNAVFQEAYARCMGTAGAPPPPPAPAVLPAGAFGATVYVSLNVRQGGSTQYPVVFVLSPGEHFTAQCSNSPYPGWCYVTRSNGQVGYASGQYIHPG
jgi:hypothetical protein